MGTAGVLLVRLDRQARSRQPDTGRSRMNARAALGKRLLALAAAVVVTAIAVIALGGATAVGVQRLHPHPLRGAVGQTIVADEGVRRLTMQRLDQLRVELDRTLGTHGAAAVKGCSRGSEGVIQPYVYKPIMEMNAEETVEALRAVGWTVSPYGFGEYDLWMRRDGWTAVGQVLYVGHVEIVVRVEDAEPCR